MKYLSRFLFCSEQWEPDEVSSIDEELKAHILEQPALPQGSTTLLSHISSQPYLTPKQQFIMLSSISNYHWLPYPSVDHPQKMVNVRPSFCQQVLQSAGKHSHKYQPTSPRNRLMYLLANYPATEDQLYAQVKHLLAVDSGHSNEAEQFTDDPSPTSSAPPPKKKRKHTSHLVRVQPGTVATEAGIDLNQALNEADQNRRLYCTFSEQLICEGIIRWRYHDTQTDICVMNDINPSTGILLPGSFVHVTARKSSSDTLITCTCQIFNLIQRAAHQDDPILPGDEVPDSSLTCMHCRFFREHLLQAYSQLMERNTNLNPILQMVQNSLQFMNDEVQLTGSVLSTGTTKFSVKGEETYSTVHMSFYRNRCFAKCTESLCSARINKKKIVKTEMLSTSKNLCSHLTTLIKQIDLVKAFFPNFFEEKEEEVCDTPGIEINNEDVNISTGMEGSFNTTTGLWTYKSLSQHKPYEMLDAKLIQCTKERNQVVSNTPPDVSGNLPKYPLKPEDTNPDGSQKMGHCGMPLTDYIQKGVATIYTRNSPMECRYFNLKCTTGCCEESFQEVAKEKGIFFSSSKTAAADEVGWDFVSLVKTTKISFTAYCNDVTRRYTTNSITVTSFMSPNTFIKWFFAWLAAFKIDFRKEIDPWCKYNPKVLACDGTHIGVSTKNLQLEKPVTRCDKDEDLHSLHRRNDRVLFPNRSERRHLMYLCKKELKKIKPQEMLDQAIEDEKNRLLLQQLGGMDADLFDFIQEFVERRQHEEVVYSQARLLHMLVGDAAMSSAVPFNSHDIIREACRQLSMNRPCNQLLEDLNKYCSEISSMFKVAIRHDCLNMCTNFVMYLVDRIEEIHAVNRPAPAANPIPGTYNPSSGVAYYFTPTGEQLREMPNYSVQGNSRVDNYDDHPDVQDACTKNYPMVSYGGFGYIFLWFCPIHGHCYGFHLIAGGEGRKDPFSSLFKYKEQMPQNLFYDFACQLNEYCLNREPELFKETRFWHDLFHALGHKCGWNFKSGRVTGMEGINSEICEQVNAFLQCVKYTASHLSQEHFVFFLQFFIYLLNKDKTARFQRQAGVALAGNM